MDHIFQNIADNYNRNGGNVITILQETQEALGYIPREAVDFFSKQLGIAPSRFYGVATFYSQFRLTPAGRNRITACCGTACHVRGAERLLNGIRRELNLSEEEETTPDREFTIEKVACLGFCSFAPVVLVNGEVHGKAASGPVLKEIRRLKKKE